MMTMTSQLLTLMPTTGHLNVSEHQKCYPQHLYTIDQEHLTNTCRFSCWLISVDTYIYIHLFVVTYGVATKFS